MLPALVEALVGTAPDVGSACDHAAAVSLAAVFVDGQIDALPALLQIGVVIGLAGFRGYVAVRYRARFGRLDHARRVAAVESWANGPIAPCRQLFRVLRNLSLLAYFEALARRSPADAGAATDAAQTGASGCGGASRPTARSPDRALRVGVLVIGSGAGGSVTGLELASHGHDVLLVEEGDHPGERPADPGATATMARLYRAGGMTPILGHVPIAYVEGRCLGGSTEINSGFWHRPPLETVLRWKAQYGLDGASAPELRPHWEWAEERLDVRLERGPWPPSTEVFARGARAMDWAVSEVPRTAARARAACGTPAQDGRPGPGMSRSLIPSAVCAGARLLTGHRVERLVTRGSRLRGAVLRRRDPNGAIERTTVLADHVFVCAGPTETPALLRRSGITRHVGNSLRIHPMLKVAARFPERMCAGHSALPLLQVKEFWPEIVLGGSYFSPGHLAVVLSDNWTAMRDRMQHVGYMASYYIGVRGTGRGRVRPSRLEADRTEIRYELSDEDIWNLSRGLARLSAMLLEAGALEVLPAVNGVPSITNEVEAVRWLDDRLDGSACSLTTVHAFSSCPIGERQDRCAANSYGQLHGYENGYINDASMLPDSPGVNPQGTIMTFARRNALHFCDAHRA